MKRVGVFILSFILASVAYGQDISGKWLTIDEKRGEAVSVVNIVLDGDSLRVIVEELLLSDPKNPNNLCLKCKGERKNQPVIGMVIIGAKKEGEEYRGWAFDPETGIEANCKLWLDENGMVNMKGWKGPFSRTQKWKRYE